MFYCGKCLFIATWHRIVTESDDRPPSTPCCIVRCCASNDFMSKWNSLNYTTTTETDDVSGEKLFWILWKILCLHFIGSLVTNTHLLQTFRLWIRYTFLCGSLEMIFCWLFKFSFSNNLIFVCFSKQECSCIVSTGILSFSLKSSMWILTFCILRIRDICLPL